MNSLFKLLSCHENISDIMSLLPIKYWLKNQSFSLTFIAINAI